MTGHPEVSGLRVAHTPDEGSGEGPVAGGSPVDPPATAGDDDGTARMAVMAGIWRDVLKIDTVGLDDDFFALGGDSLLAIRVVLTAEKRGLPVTLLDLFKHPTVRGLSAVLGD